MKIETVFAETSGYPMSFLASSKEQYYYVHALDIYDGIILYSVSPICYDKSDKLMRNNLQLRDIVLDCTHTLECNTANGFSIWRESSGEQLTTIPEVGLYLYS